MTKTAGITAAWWAIFSGNGEYHEGVYTDENDANDDLWGRPDGCYVGRACQCAGPVRPADECIVCGFEAEES